MLYQNQFILPGDSTNILGTNCKLYMLLEPIYTVSSKKSTVFSTYL